jgi:hypothetical protein
VTGQVGGCQPPDEAGRAEEHDIEFTVSAHPLMVGMR